MKKQKYILSGLALLYAAALMLSSCAESEHEQTSAERSDTTPSHSETNVITESAYTSSETSKSEFSGYEASGYETTYITSAQTSVYSSETESSPETGSETESVLTEVSTAVITESYASELYSSDETTLISEAQELTTTLSETEPVSTSTVSGYSAASAEVIVPQIKKGHFTGAEAIGNDLVTVDISDTSSGAVCVSCGSTKRVKVRITKDEQKYDYDFTPSADNIYPLQMGSGSYNIKVYENVSGKSYATIFDEDFSVSLADEFQPYLIPTQFVMYSQNSKCVYKAAELCAGCESNIDKAAAIFKYISDSITYDKELASSVQSGYIPSPDSALAAGKGICFDYASLFAAMCRSQGIPTKLVIGYVNTSIYHAWNEIYTEDTGWIAVDIYLSKKGYNLVDPTFYASAQNKSDAAEFIGNGKNYSAMLYY